MLSPTPSTREASKTFSMVVETDKSKKPILAAFIQEVNVGEMKLFEQL
jgi:hypothetical protein